MSNTSRVPLLVAAFMSLVVVVLSMVFLLTPYPAGFIGDGDYELTVFVKSKSAAPIRKVQCILYSDISEAKAAAKTFSFGTPQRCIEEYDPDTSKLTILAPFTISNKKSMFGKIYDERDWQYNGMLVSAFFEDGRIFSVPTAVPSRHLMRSIQVEIP